MEVYQEIEKRLQKTFSPILLQIIDESDKHRGHLHGPNGQQVETHFKITMISSLLNNLNRLESHRLVYKALNDLMPTPVHALRLELKGIYEKM